jgi:hypothetical protein
LALEIQPNSPKLHLNKSAALLLLKYFHEADQLAQKALADGTLK